MSVGELPLVLFTLLTQMAVGSFVVLGAVHVRARRRYPATTVDRLSDPALFAIGPVMVAALVVSLLHRGNPVDLLGDVGSSWSSREVLLGCVFTALGAGFALLQWRRWLTPGTRQVVAGVTAVVGLAFVWAGAQVYRVPTVPAWGSWATPVAFLATTFLLGCLAVGAAFVVAASARARRPDRSATAGDAEAGDAGVDAMLRRSLRGIGLTAIGLLVVQLLVLPAWLIGLANDGSPAASAAAEALTAGGWLHLRLVLAVLGAGVLALVLHRVAAAGGRRLLLVTAGAAFVLVLVAEAVGRAQLLEAYARIGG
jgi:anaerobic dimethyl sulfoxide reductase subunit C (anchor subunit)